AKGCASRGELFSCSCLLLAPCPLLAPPRSHNLLSCPKNDDAIHPAAFPHPPVRLGPEKSNATAGSLTSRTSAIIFTPRPRPFSAPYRPGSICANNARPFYDQGQLGSCTANAIGGAIEFD